MTRKFDLEALWNASSSEKGVFQPNQLCHIPAAAQCYLEHAIAPGTRLASAVRLQMRGEIKLRRWLPFTAEQVIRWDCGMIWSATAWINGMPIRGSDRLVNGEGAMRWKIFGIFPVMTASGPDITRSAIGRVQVESIWLPSALCLPDVTWTEADKRHPVARFALNGETTELHLALEDTGRVKTASLSRWGNPAGGAFQYENFGGIVEEERAFDGCTIPTRLRVGWRFGTDRFESDGEFFRAVIDHAIYR